MPETLICGVLSLEFDSLEKAAKSAEKLRDCPHIWFWATKGSTAHIVLTVPEGKKWWAEYIADHPERTFGGNKADLIFQDRVHQPQMLEMRIPSELGERTPCGSHCPSCPSYIRCIGCPATIPYKRER